MIIADNSLYSFIFYATRKTSANLWILHVPNYYIAINVSVMFHAQDTTT